MEELNQHIKYNLPYLDRIVYLAKEMNETRGVEDNQPNIIEAMMAILSIIASKPKKELQPPGKWNDGLERMETDSSEQIRKINKINSEIRCAINEYNQLLEKIKTAKESVVQEYKDILGEFRGIMEDSDESGEVSEVSGMNQFHQILENVIREVLVETNAIPLTSDEDDKSTVNEEEQKTEFEQLFEDQQLVDSFDEMFDTQQPPPPPPVFGTNIATPPPQPSARLRRRNAGMTININ